MGDAGEIFDFMEARSQAVSASETADIVRIEPSRSAP